MRETRNNSHVDLEEKLESARRDMYATPTHLSQYGWPTAKARSRRQRHQKHQLTRQRRATAEIVTPTATVLEVLTELLQAERDAQRRNFEGKHL